jgi:hypothetical protein
MTTSIDQLHQRRPLNAIVIYLTQPMTFSIRAVSVLLVVWLGAAASFHPCCWSINAHGHQAQQEAPAVRQHTHHHHGAADSSVSVTTAPVIAATAADECDRESLQAVLTTRAFVPFDVMRESELTFANLVTLQVSPIRGERSDAAPPGCSPGAAFLNPLRV